MVSFGKFLKVISFLVDSKIQESDFVCTKLPKFFDLLPSFENGKTFWHTFKTMGIDFAQQTQFVIPKTASGLRWNLNNGRTVEKLR